MSDQRDRASSHDAPLKACFQFGGNSSHHTLHQLARRLVASGRVAPDACAVMIEHQPEIMDFLKSQSDLRYEPILTFADVSARLQREELDLDRLAALEQRVGRPNLWSFAVADRHLGSGFINGAVLPQSNLLREADHRRIQHYLQVELGLFVDWLSEQRPDVVIAASPPASLGLFGILACCEALGIPYRLPGNARAGARWTIIDNFQDSFTSVWGEFRDPEGLSGISGEQARDQARQWVADFRSKPVVPGYQVPINETVKRNMERSWLSIGVEAARVYAHALVAQVRSRNSAERHLPTWISPWERTRLSVRRLIASRKLRDGSVFGFPGKSEPYLFFPLHLTPEFSTMVLAPLFSDQVAVVRMLSMSVPMGWKVYVKEHPSTFRVRLRDANFYAQLQKLPNVELIHPFADTIELIRRAEVVAVITGTSGWEALLLDKPVICLGHTFYNGLEACCHCTDPTRFADEIQALAAEDRKPGAAARNDEVERFVACIFRHSVELTTIKQWSDVDQGTASRHGDDLDCLARLLERSLDGLPLSPVAIGRDGRYPRDSRSSP